MGNNKKIIVPDKILSIYKELSIYRTKEWLSTVSEENAEDDVIELRRLVSVGAITVKRIKK
jgi:hypothetical protein